MTRQKISFAVRKKTKMVVPWTTTEDLEEVPRVEPKPRRRRDILTEESETTLKERGNVLAEDGRMEEAIVQWKIAIEIHNPDSAVLHELIAQGYMALRQDFLALQVCL